MEISFPISKDEDGFVWRQCPTCECKFKWHDGSLPGYQAVEQAPKYYCPICGHPADLSSWFTYEQIEAAENATMPQLHQLLGDELSRIGTPRRGSLVSIDWKIEMPEVGTTPLESHDDDHDIVASPCHPGEPVKVPVEEGAEFYCLVCGSRFRV